ncbi:hypothetical protein ABK040_008012 [Willaertia magna]
MTCCREIVSIHLGNAGIKSGSTYWDLITLEHDIQKDGSLLIDESNEALSSKREEENLNSLFFETNNKYTPRCLFIDSGEESINTIRNTNPDFYLNEQFISLNNYNSFKTGREELLDSSLDKIRKLVENCSGFEGFLIYNSISGGTGSVYGSLLLERLSEEFGKKSKVNFTIFPTRNELKANPLHVFNSIMYTYYHNEHTDASVVFSNDALKEICHSSLKIENPSHSVYNQLIAQAVSSTTIGLRKKSAVLLENLDSFRTSLIPFPTLQYLSCSYSPFISSLQTHQFTLQEMFQSCLNGESCLTTRNLQTGCYLSMILILRGDSYTPAKFNFNFNRARRVVRPRFVDMPNFASFNCCLDYHSPKVIVGGDLAKVSDSVFAVSNNTSVLELFNNIRLECDKLNNERKEYFRDLIKKQCTIEVDEFNEAIGNLDDLVEDCLEIERNINEDEES